MSQAVETATGPVSWGEGVSPVRDRRAGEGGGTESEFVARLGAMFVGGFLPADAARETLTQHASAGEPTARQRVEAEYREQLAHKPMGNGGLADQAAEQLTQPAGGGATGPDASDRSSSRESGRGDGARPDRGADAQTQAQTGGSRAPESATPGAESGVSEQTARGAVAPEGQSPVPSQAGQAAASGAVRPPDAAGPPGNETAVRAAAVKVAGAAAKPGAAQPVQGATGKNGASVRNGVRAPKAAAKPPSPFRTEQQVRAQVERGLAAVLRQRGGSVTLRLTPASLGELRVKMTVKGAKVEADFEPSTKQAQRLLEQNLSALRSALEAKGLAVERLHVADAPEAHTGGGAAGDSSERAREGPGGGARSGTAGAGGASGGEDAKEGQLAGAPEDAGIIEIGGAVIRIDTLA